jgi:hypothetical protein
MTSPTLVQIQQNQGNDASPVVSIASTAGNALVATFSGWMTGNVPLSLASVQDSAGNNWTYSTSTNLSNNPPAAGVFDSGQDWYSFSGIAWCLPSNNGGTTKAVTEVTVNFTAAPTVYEMAFVMEFANVPANAVALAGASSNTVVSAYTSYNTPSITTTSSSPVLAVANTSVIEAITGTGTGWALTTAGGNTNGAYNLAQASGTFSALLTQTTASDIPTSNIVAFGVPVTTSASPQSPYVLLLTSGSM